MGTGPPHRGLGEGSFAGPGGGGRGIAEGEKYIFIYMQFCLFNAANYIVEYVRKFMKCYLTLPNTNPYSNE